MKPLKIFGKYLDQPMLVAKFEKNVPYILTTGGALYTAHAVKHAEQSEEKETLLRVGLTMSFTILSALLAPKITNKIFKVQTRNLQQIINENKLLINKFLEKNSLDNKSKEILEKAKDKVLNLKEIQTLAQNSNKTKNFLNKLIPEPENIGSKEIFSEIGRLSLLGLIPVIGGITGGTFGDIITTPSWKEKFPNKVKEGAYQYLANIFLCNVGAGIALVIMEKLNIRNKTTRAIGMITGIVATGIIGGSAIANLIGNKIINPIFGEKKNSNLYSERKPEALDIGLHTDDIATVAVMSGLKWIEPALPIMYSISGFRAGIGYRNVKNCNDRCKY